MTGTRDPAVQLHIIAVGLLQTNCYILQSGPEGIVVDPGDEPDRIIRYLQDVHMTPKLIVATHAHFDHVLAVSELRTATHAKFAIHKDDLSLLQSTSSSVHQHTGRKLSNPPPNPDLYLKEDDLLSFGTGSVKVVHTPGHSPGSVSLVGKGFVLTGDALFNHSIGRTDLPGGNTQQLLESIRQKLFKLDDYFVVHPGHGPDTTIGDEKLTNPYVGDMVFSR